MQHLALTTLLQLPILPAGVATAYIHIIKGDGEGRERERHSIWREHELDSCRIVMVTMKCRVSEDSLFNGRKSREDEYVLDKVRGAEDQIICSDQCM